MGVNKVVYGGGTLIDLTGDTVTANTMLNGTKAHDRTGTIITGTVTFITVYTGTTDPPANIGTDGDIYLKVVT